jgi:hypothetical protein
LKDIIWQTTAKEHSPAAPMQIKSFRPIDYMDPKLFAG